MPTNPLHTSNLDRIALDILKVIDGAQKAWDAEPGPGGDVQLTAKKQIAIRDYLEALVIASGDPDPGVPEDGLDV